MARRALLSLLLGCLLALTASPALAAAAEGGAQPPLPVVPEVGAALGETVGKVTTGTQQAVEAVTSPAPAPSAPPPVPAAPPSGPSGGRPSGGGPVEQVTHVAAEAVPAVTKAVAEATGGAKAKATAGASQDPTPSAAPEAAGATPAEPVATASTSPSVEPAGPSAGAPRDRHPGRAHQPGAAAPGPDRRRADPLATAIAPLLDARDSSLPSTADLGRSASSFVSGLGARLADLAGPLAGGAGPAVGTSGDPGSEGISDARAAEPSSALPSLSDPSRPASMLLFLLVLGGGGALLVYAFRRELVGGPSRWRRHRT